MQYDGSEAPDAVAACHVHGQRKRLTPRHLPEFLQRSFCHHLPRTEARVVVVVRVAQGLDAGSKHTLDLCGSANRRYK